MSGMTNTNQPIEYLRLGDLKVIYPDAQRSLDKRKADLIAAELDPDALGVLVVMLPDKYGYHHIIDGQHRWWGLLNHPLWGGKQQVPCLVLQTNDPARAAKIWSLMNSRRAKPSALDRFRVAVTAGMVAETAVNELLIALGYHIGSDTRDGAFYAVDGAVSIYRRRGKDALLDTMLVIRAAWGRAAGTASAPMLDGSVQPLGEVQDADRSQAAG